MKNQFEEVKGFHLLHTTEKPLILPNAWDVGSAKVIEESGAQAIATSSWAVARANGYNDGEKIPLDFVLANIRRIKNNVSCPITLDIETGYSKTPEGVAETIKEVINAGVVGINLEDQNLNDGEGKLYSIDEQTQRIRSARIAADEQSIPLFINARTDVFFQSCDKSDKQQLLDEVLERTYAYAKAGANGIFVPGLADKKIAQSLCQNSPLPVNLMMTTFDKEELKSYIDIGVARISFGPLLYMHAISILTTLSKQLLTT